MTAAAAPAATSATRGGLHRGDGVVEATDGGKGGSYSPDVFARAALTVDELGAVEASHQSVEASIAVVTHVLVEGHSAVPVLSRVT